MSLRALTMPIRPPARRASGARLARLAPVALLALAGACGSITDDAPPPVELRGAWHYTAQQTAPAPATLEGDLVVDEQAGRQLGGSLDVVETSAAGQDRLTGIVSGQVPDEGSIDFDAFLTGAARRHVGTIADGVIEGTWAEFGTGGDGASGTFRAVRAAAP